MRLVTSKTHGGARAGAGRKPGKPNTTARPCDRCGKPVNEHRVCARDGALLHDEPGDYCDYCNRNYGTQGLCWQGPCQAFATVLVGKHWYCAGCAQMKFA